MQLRMNKVSQFFFGIRDCRRKHILIVIVIVFRAGGEMKHNKEQQSNRICHVMPKADFSFHNSDGNQSENSPKKRYFRMFLP